MPETTPSPLTATAVQKGISKALVASNEHAINNPEILEPCHQEKEGCDHIVWSAGPYILHALLATPKNQKSLERDRAVTKLIKSQLISNPEIISIPSQTFLIEKWLCTIQPRLPGTSLEAYYIRATKNHNPIPEKTIQNLIDVLKTLHSIPRTEAVRLTSYKHERPNLHKRVKKATRQWEELKNIKYVNDPEDRMKEALSLSTLQSSLQSSLSISTSTYTPSFLHGDFSMQHILLDPSDGTITGIIDWSDAMLGDAAEDLAGLALSIGAGNARRVGKKVGYDECTIERGLVLAKCLAIEDLRELKCGLEKQPPERLLRLQFGMAFEGWEFEFWDKYE